MEIEHVEKKERGFFAAKENGKEAGLMTYTYIDNRRFIIDHTEVDDEFNGRGVGKAMVMEAVKYARTKDLKILPLCPFAKSIFNKTPEIADVLYKPY